MKNLTLIKQHPCVQLGHLYEHLFMRELNKFFYERNLFKHLDYAATGTTYEQGGIISVDVELYTEQTLVFEQELQHIPIDFGPHNQTVSLELARMSAEKEDKLYITDKQLVLSMLQELDNTPWLHIDTINQIDTTKIRHKFDPIYTTNIPQTKPRQLHVTLNLDEEFAKNNRQVAPLFNLIARIYALAFESQLAAHFGFYGDDLDGRPRPLTVRRKLVALRQYTADIDMSTLTQLASSVSKYVFSSEVIDRIARSLRNTNYRDDILSAQSIDRIITETGVLTGSAGWRAIATAKNINDILANTSLTIKFGRQKITRPLIQK